MPKRLIFALQKGGVGKTTSTVAAAEILSAAGCRVLVVDFDSQGNATPMTSRKVSNFKGELDLVNGTYSVEFNCFGIDYKSSQDLNKLMTTLRVKK